MDETKQIVTTAEELKGFVNDLKADIVAESKAATMDAMKAEQASKELPDVMKSTRVTEMRAKANDNALALGLYALGAKGKFNTPIENTYKLYGAEPSMFVTDEMRFNMENEKTLNLGFNTKAMNMSSATDGGFGIAEIYSPQIIPMIQDQSVFRKAGPKTQAMPNGNLTMTKVLTGTSAYWVGENTAKTSSGKTYGQIRLDAKKLTAQVPVTNDLLKMANIINIGQDIVTDLSTQIGLKQDQTFLMTGTGTAYTPKSLNSMATTGNSNAMTLDSAAVTAATIAADLEKAYGLFVKNLINPVRGAWFMTPEAAWKIQCQRTTLGVLYDYAEELRTKGTLFGMPVYMTTYMRASNGASSSILLAEMNYVFVGDVAGIEIKFTPDAAYQDGSTVYSGLSRDESVYTATIQTDLDVAYTDAIARITGVTWGI